MLTQEDTVLLQEWVEDRSEAAFRRLVDRYAPLVWGAAMRKTGDPGMAEEAAQQVFADLAGKAAVLVKGPRPLAAWLHRSAVFEAVQILRREHRYRERMKHYANTGHGTPSPADVWEEVRPHLDDAINSLNEKDRRVLLLHWFERRTFAEVARQTGSTPEAAQRRGLRALSKLGAALRRRGAAASTAVLAAGLTAQLIPSVPAAVTSALWSNAPQMAIAATSGPNAFFHQCMHAMASAKLTTAAVILLSAALPFGVRLAAIESPHKAALTNIPAPVPQGDGVLGSAGFAPGAPTPSLDLRLIQQALNRLMENPRDYQTQLELRRLMFALSAEEIPGVEKLLLSAAGRNPAALGEVSYTFFARWAELDPAAAAQAALAPATEPFGQLPLRGAFVTWASADLDGAWAWLEKSVSNPAIRRLIGGEAIALLAADQTKSAAIMARVDAMKDEPWRNELREQALRSWTRTSWPVAAMEWAAQIPDARERDEWMARAVTLTGEVMAANGLNNLHRIEDPQRRAEAARNILRPHLLANPEEVSAQMADRAAELPSGVFRDAGDALARHDPAKALVAVDRVPEGNARGQFVQGMLEGAAYSDGVAVLPALEMIDLEDPACHDGLGNFADLLTKQNPRAAAAWITSLPITSIARELADLQFKSVAGCPAAEFTGTTPK